MDDSLGDRLKADMISAMRAKEKERLAVLRMLIAKLKDAAINKRDVLSAEEELRLISTYAKQREEGVVEAERAGARILPKKNASSSMSSAPICLRRSMMRNLPRWSAKSSPPKGRLR